MNSSRMIAGIALTVFLGAGFGAFADDTKVVNKKSLEGRIAELEAKLKDAGAGGGVQGSGIKVSGYVDTSYTLNLADRDSSGPVAGSSLQNTGRVFDQAYDGFNLNAVKLTIEKSKDSSKFPAGFRVDSIVGHDAKVLKNVTRGWNGIGESEMFLEQAFVDLGIPVGNGIDVKVGRMASLIGYEVIESPANWQFSRSEAFRLSPFVQQGATFAYAWNDTVTTTLGLINGWDSEVLNGGGEASNFNTDLSFIGKVDVTGPKTSFGEFSAFVVGLYGNDAPNGVNTTLNRANVYLWNIGGNWVKPFGAKDLTLGIEYLYRHQENPFGLAVVDQLVPISAQALTVYGKWDWTSLGANWTSTSGRFGYSIYQNNSFQNNNQMAQTLSPLAVPAAGFNARREEVFNFTLTQAFNVWKDTLVRLEWRHDWTPNKASGFGIPSAAANGDDIRQDQDTIAVNVVYSF